MWTTKSKITGSIGVYMYKINKGLGVRVKVRVSGRG